MKQYLDFIIRHPLPVILIILALSLVLGSGLPKLDFDSSLDVMMPKEDPEYLLNEKVKDTYGNNGNFIIMDLQTDNALDPEFLRKVDRLHRDLEEYRIFNESREKQRLKELEKVLPSVSTFRELKSAFLDDPVFIRVLERKFARISDDRKGLSPDEKEELLEGARKAAETKSKRIIDEIISPFTVRDLKGENDILRSYHLIPRDLRDNRIIPHTEEEIEQFRKRMTHNPSFENGIYVKDPETGKITDFSVVIRIYDDAKEDPIALAVQEIADSYSDIDIAIQGIPIFYKKINDYMRNDLITFTPLVLLVVVIIFFFNFRSLRGVVLPFITLSLADLWVLGLMGHLGYKLSVIGVALPPLMIAVGSSYSIHILNQYYIDIDEMKKKNHRPALLSIMLHISTTVLLAGLTTFVGFFMLITNQVAAIRIWGVFSAVGIIFAVFISISLLPAGLSLLKSAGQEKKKTATLSTVKLVGLFTEGLSWLIERHYRKVLAATAIIVVLALAGAFQMTVETSLFSYFKDDDPILADSREIGRKFGGAYGLNILIHTHEKNGVKDPEFLKFVEEFREWLVSEENIDLNIGRTDAITDFIMTMNMAMHNDKEKYYRVPEKKIDVQSYIDIYSGEDDNDDGRIDDFESYVNRHFETANIFARMWEREGELLGSKKLAYTVNRIEAHLDKTLPESWSYRISGEPKIIVALAHHVVVGQMMSLIFSLIVVALVVFLLFQRASVSLLAMIPISFAVLFNFGVMGWFGLRLDVATAIIASITIGIGIDDTIHFLNSYRKFQVRGLSMDRSIAETLKVSGRAITYTSLALIFGFLVFVFSNFKPIIYFGMLVAVTMVATTIGALLILPSMIKLTGVRIPSEFREDGIWKYISLNRLFNLDEM
jgi:hypothetical protein